MKPYLLAGLVAVAGIGLLWWGTSPNELESVLVLPLRNVSLDPSESDYLADGISRAVITKLTQTGLRVTPWETALRHAASDTPADEIARSLNADAVLVGTFDLVDDERIVATLSLIEASSGFQTWASDFDEPYEDLFDVQRRIAEGAAMSLKQELSGEEFEALSAPESGSVDAYDSYLQGAHVLYEESEEANQVALQYFDRAIELDPELVDAHVGRGAVFYQRYFNGWGGGQANLKDAEAAFEQALRLDSSSTRARQGLIRLNWERGRMEPNLRHGQQAASLAPPNDVEALVTRAQAYMMGGLPGRAEPLLRDAIALDPFNETAYWFRAMCRIYALDYRGGIEAANEYLERFGDEGELHHWVGIAYQALGDREKAKEHYASARGVEDRDSESEVAATNSNLQGFLAGGLLDFRTGDRERATELWRTGLELAESRLELAPDNARMHWFRAVFLGFLGERERFAEAEAAFRSVTSYTSLGYQYLVLAHAHLGDVEEAVSILEDIVRRGRVHPEWKLLRVLASRPLEGESFDEFVAFYESEERRLRERY